MEKTASTTAIIKRSMSEIADVDLQILRCRRCLHLLVPPVLQCAAGHLICSSCHDNLPDKNKCASCVVTSFISTSYSRCHAVEGILGSIRVACPNEKVEHEKTCPSVVPRSVWKMGPCGGVGGEVREMDVHGVNRIVKVVVWYRVNTIDAMTVFHERNGREEPTDQWGFPIIKDDGKSSEVVKICLEPEEYLTGVKGHLGDWNGMFCVRSLTFMGSRHTFGPYGGVEDEDGAPFELPAAGGRIVGFHGRSQWYLNAIGTYVNMDVVEICLEQGEYLSSVKGHIGDWDDWLSVRSLMFISNLHTFGPYGKEDGETFELLAAAGGRIVGFHGRSDSYLDAIGTYVKMDI